MTLTSQARPKSIVIDALHSSQLGYGFEGSVGTLKTDIANRVVLLLRARSPFAIALAVIAVYVDSFERFSRWAFAHISQERFKIVRPFWAHRYATSAVAMVTGSGCVETPTFGINPSGIFFGFLTIRKPSHGCKYTIPITEALTIT
jgi:hypothetical protein